MDTRIFGPPASSLDPAHVLFGKTRKAILQLLFYYPEHFFNLRDIARHTGISPGAIHRDVTKLYRCGIIDRMPYEWWVNYRPNMEHPLYDDLESIVHQTMGFPVLNPVQPVIRGIENL